MNHPTTFRIPTGNNTEDVVHVVEYYDTWENIEEEYDEIIFCVDPLRNLNVDYSINRIKKANDFIKKTYNSDVVIVKIKNEYKIRKSRFYEGDVVDVVENKLSATPYKVQTTIPKKRTPTKKKRAKITPPIGILYILNEGNNAYWIAIDYNTFERIGTVRNTRTLQLIPKHDLEKYINSGLIEYSGEN